MLRWVGGDLVDPWEGELIEFCCLWMNGRSVGWVLKTHSMEQREKPEHLWIIEIGWVDEIDRRTTLASVLF